MRTKAQSTPSMGRKAMTAATLVALVVLSAVGATTVSAQIPRTVSHQGLLTLPGGSAAPDGNYTMTFRIYNLEYGGTALWTEAQTLALSGGVYNATLGSVTTLNLPFDVQYWLGVQLSGESEMAPRVRLTSAPYAYRAVVAEGLAGGTAGDITAVYANDGLAGGATSGDAPLSVGAGTGIQVSVDAVALAPSYADGSAYDARFVNEGQGNSVTADMVVPNIVGALDGVTNDGGNIDLIAGANVTITPDDANNQITISASGGGGGIGGSGTANYLSKFTGPTTIGNSLLYDNGQRVGIGTTAPGSRLTVTGVTNSDAVLELRGGGYPGVSIVRTDPGWAKLQFWSQDIPTWSIVDDAEGPLSFYRANATHAVLKLHTTGVKAIIPYLNPTDPVAFSAKYDGWEVADVIGVKGQSTPGDWYGVGGSFVGGYKGAVGNVWPSGSATYTGVEGGVSGGSGMNIGLRGWAAGGGSNYGLYATAEGGASNYAGGFFGDVLIQGDLYLSGSKSFRIDHPLDPANKYLNHFSVESDEVLNTYTGNVILDDAGEAWVALADWFGEINRDPRYQLTCIGGHAPVYIASKISGNRFKIAGGTPGLEVSWQVTAVRSDPTVRKLAPPVEQEKPAPERGKYVDPESYGMPASMRIGLPEGKKTE
ncbi:MAG: hypothetical protein FJY88_13735 [Candidatus Eisenbacteria bacterium]|nr:hypothetical protein [Candidatus Eisenbacteria bacterium]